MPAIKNPAGRISDQRGCCEARTDYFGAEAEAGAEAGADPAPALSFFAILSLAGLSMAAGADAAASGNAWPLTVSPACDSLTAFFLPMPFTRFSKSAQSLKAPPLVRSSMMTLE